MFGDSVVVVVAAVVRTRPRAIPLAMITMRKSTHGFPSVSPIWVAYGAPLGGPRRSSAIKLKFTEFSIKENIKDCRRKISAKNMGMI